VQALALERAHLVAAHALFVWIPNHFSLFSVVCMVLIVSLACKSTAFLSFCQKNR